MSRSTAPKRPIVAIVGRPNVGKSTMFNRLTSTRDALVSDLPGLTRDRREGVAEIDGHPMTIVDTAGLEEATRGSIADRMRGQSEEAIRLADVVLFVIDARDGVTPADEGFGQIARVSGKPVILVANKCEGRAANSEGFFEAYKLGLGEPIALSAEHGQGFGDLHADILAALGLKSISKAKRRRRGQEPEPEIEVVEEAVGDDPLRPIRVAVVGRPNAGKSTLVNALAGEERMITGPEPGLTRDSVSTDVDWKGRPVRLFDTAGLRRKARIHEKAEQLSASDAVRAIRFAEVVVLLIDAERPLEQQDLTIAEMITEEGRGIVLAINKWDLIEDKEKLLKDIRETVTEKLSQVPGVELVTLSALSGRGIDKLQKAVVRAYEIWNKRVPTNALNRWLGKAMQRHTAPAAQGRRVKIRFMTQPSTRPPTFVAFCSQPKGLPQAYVRYLTNSLREEFDMPGVPIRFNLRKGDNPYVD